MSHHGAGPTLAGVLSGFALADVLQLLELGARSGDLVVDAGIESRAAVRLRAGRVVSVTDGASGRVIDDRVAAITRMLDWAAGRWAFRAHAESDPIAPDPGRDDGLAITTLLVEAARRRDEHARRAARSSPALPDVPVLADGDPLLGEPADDPASWSAIGNRAPSMGRLTAADLQILAAVDGVRDLEALAAITRRDVADVDARIGRLRAHRVLRPRMVAPRGTAA